MEDTLQTWGRPQSSPNGSGEMSGLLFVGGLPLHACDQNLTRYFRRFGPLDSAEVQRRSTGRSKGYAFIQFVRPADALKVLHRQHSILGQVVAVTVAKKSVGEEANFDWNPRSSRRVFVHNIPLHLQAHQLVGYLSRYVQVEHVSLLRTQPGGPAEQFCYVIPKHLKDSRKLLNMGKIVTEDGLVLKFKPPISKFDKRVANQVNKQNEVENQLEYPISVQPARRFPEEKYNRFGESEQGSKSYPASVHHSRSIDHSKQSTSNLIHLRKGLWIPTPHTEFSSESEANYRYRILGESRDLDKVEEL